MKIYKIKDILVFLIYVLNFVSYLLLLPTDMFAQSSCARPADVNCDQLINNLDIMIILSSWSTGGTSEYSYREDVYDDNKVNSLDIVEVLRQWSSSPFCGDTICNGEENCYNCPGDCGSCPPGGGVLQFKSGFDPDTHIESNTIRGIDYNAPQGVNNWDNLENYLGWAKYTDFYFQGGSAEIVQKDPVNPNNWVLHLHNKQIESGLSRSQWALKQVSDWSDDGQPNLFDKQFYRYRLYIPLETKNTNLTNWYMIWEAHVWELENTRDGIYLRKNSDNNEWHFRVLQESPEGCHANPVNCDYYWENNGQWLPYFQGQNITVPFGEWFWFDVFFKYHETDGEFYVAITRESGSRQIVAHYFGQTKYGTKLRNNVVFKFYHDDEYLIKLPNGTHQYYDNFEIWSDYPPGYWNQ